MKQQGDQCRLKCPLCHRAYNLGNLCPRVLTACRHTLCQRCLMKRIALLKPGTPLTCYTCPEQQDLQGDIVACIRQFPKNEYLISLISGQESDKENGCCGNPNTKSPFLCVARGCKNRSLFCQRCVGIQHIKCDEKFFVPKDQLKSKVVVERAELDFDDLEFRISELVSQKFLAAKRRVLSFVGAALNQLKGSHNEVLDFEKMDMDQVLKSAQSRFDPDLEVVRLTLPQEESVAQQAARIEEYFLGDFWQKLDAFLGLQMVNFVNKFDTGDDKSELWSPLLGKLREADPLCLQYYALRNLSIKPVFSLAEFAKDVKKALAPHSLAQNLLKINESELDHRIEAKVIGRAKALLAEGVLDSHRLKQSLEDLLSAESGEPDRKWTVTIGPGLLHNSIRNDMGSLLDFTLNDLRFVVACQMGFISFGNASLAPPPPARPALLQKNHPNFLYKPNQN